MNEDMIDDVESFRLRLQKDLRDDFFDKIKNEDDAYAEREQLLSMLHEGFSRLLEIEAGFVNDVLSAHDEGICPGCLISATRDLTNAKSLAALFNHYITTMESNAHH